MGGDHQGGRGDCKREKIDWTIDCREDNFYNKFRAFQF